MKYIGIDVSKNTFDVAYSSEKGGKTANFKNTAKGVHSFIKTVSKEEDICVMEATGNYSALLAYLLSEAGITFCMENPLKIKQFSRAMLSVTKTDKMDARLIALYGERMQPSPYKLQGDKILLLKQRRTVLRQLQKQLLAMSNLKGSMEVLPIHDKTADDVVKKTIAFLEKQVVKVREELEQSTKTDFSKMMELICSVKGVGVSVAAALILTTGAFTYFDNAKQVSRYLGLCPTYQQSGTSVNVKGRINHNGDSYTRQQLYMASWSASQYNTACKECYDRLRSNGKSGKVAMIAVANKLVRQIFAVVKSGVPYEDGFVSSKPSINSSAEGTSVGKGLGNQPRRDNPRV